MHNLLKNRLQFRLTILRKNMKRTAAVWKGSGKVGSGYVSTESGIIIFKTDYRQDGDCECYIVNSGAFFLMTENLIKPDINQ